MGIYTITETQRFGFDLTGVGGDLGHRRPVTTAAASRTCWFTLNRSTDNRKVFTNIQRGVIIVRNDTDPEFASGSLRLHG